MRPDCANPLEMDDLSKSHEQLASEVRHLRQRIAELDRSAPPPQTGTPLLRAALNASHNSVVITDRAGAVEWINPAFCTLTGYTAEEAVGRNLRELVRSGRHDAAFYRDLWNTILSGQIWRGETINRRKDGSLYTEEQAITPVRDGRGDITHFIAVKQDVTERARAEEEIRQGAVRSARAERDFRALFSANPLPMWIYDLATLRFLEVNEAAIREYGYGRDEFLAMTIEGIRPDEDVDSLRTLVRQPREPLRDSGNWRHRHKSGRVVEVQVTSHVITFLGRSAALVVALDVTARKRAEEEVRVRVQLSTLGEAIGLSLTRADSLAEALQQSMDAFVGHLDAALARVWTLNERDGVLELQASAGLYTHVNGRHARIPLGRCKIGRIAQGRQPHVTNAVIGDPQVLDQDWARREGIVAFAGHPLILEGRVIGVMALYARHALPDTVVSALTSVADHLALGVERLRSAEALRSAEERMRFVLQNANVGVWDLDYTTGALRWSETLEAQYGLQPGSFDGTFEAFIERVHPDDRTPVLETFRQARKAGAEFSLENRAVWPDGTVRWLTGPGRVLVDGHGVPVRGVGISLDVTDRRALEAQYQQAQKMEAVGRLAGGIAHDFNNLLSAILGYCELLLPGFHPGDPRRADLEQIRHAGTSAARLTRQLLAFSRKQITEPRLLDLKGVVTGLRPMLETLIGEAVKVVLNLESDTAPVRADWGQMEQIVMNLAVNARDAMPDGGTVTIATSNVELDEHYAAMHPGVKPGAFVALTVTDTGAGITPEVQARLFEPFFTTKEVGKGTGLGLATVHGIVKQSGGSVAVYSEVGMGASFRVYLPRVAPADMVGEAAQPADRSGARAETVLVVDDGEGMRELARRLLERQGYTVLVAANADEALRSFQTNPRIDLLLTDVVMPGTSGPELTRRLAAQQPALKVIYMSGYTEDDIVGQEMLKPGTAFLNKPFTADALGRKVREVLDR